MKIALQKSTLVLATTAILFLLNIPTARCDVRDSLKARELAESFLNEKLTGSINARLKVPAPELRQVYISPESAASPVYLFENETGGYVMIVQTGDQLLAPSYSTRGSLNMETASPAFKALIAAYEKAESISFARIKAQSVSPLLEIEQINWNQEGFYNYSCPYDAAAGTYAYAGCVAVAMAQTMRYFKFPATGAGSHSYVHPAYGALSADFENTTYNWASMPGALSGENTDVANLLFHCGVAVNMDYKIAAPGSAASFPAAATALRDYFRYPSAAYMSKDDFFFDSDEYLQTIRNELINGRPVIYELLGDPGHAVVCDGFDGDYFHLNFGWGGAENGYFLLSGVQYAGGEFGFLGNAIIGISPDRIPCNMQDSLALVALYNNTGGSSWSRKDNWLTGDVSSWYGVDVIGGRVAHISLADNNMQGVLPSELANLSALTRINFSSNHLSGSIEPFQNLPNLIELTLAFNQFTGSIPAGIGANTALVDLSLGNNNLTGTIPAELGNLTRLKYLSLAGNSLTGSIPPEICNLAQLRNLFLENNQLSGSFPENIGNLVNLADFHINNNQFSGLLPASIGSLTGLYSFQVNDNAFEGACPAGIGSLVKLQYLNLENNRFTSLPPEIGNLTLLLSLKANNNQLKDSIPAQIGNLVSLETLDLSANELTALPPTIGALTKLTRLNLHHNQLQALPAEIGKLNLLTELTLSNNGLKSLPYEMSFLNNLTTVSASHNQIESLNFGLSLMKSLVSVELSYNQLGADLPPLGHHKLDMLFIDHNQLTFSNIAASRVPAVLPGHHYYADQGPVPLDRDVVEFVENDTAGVDIRAISRLSHPDNVYAWYKNGQLAASGPVIGFSHATAANEGYYYCAVTNSTFTNLTLYTDSIQFKKVEIPSDKPDTLLSNAIQEPRFYYDTVTLVSPGNIRGQLVWQATVDSVEWIDLAAGVNDPRVSGNLLSVADEKVVVVPKSAASYRYKVIENDCPPLYSDTAFIGDYSTSLLLDTILNVSISPAAVRLKEIEIAVPQHFSDSDFRLTVEKVNTPPAAPDSVYSGPVYDVKISCANPFDLPLTITLKVDHDSLNASNVPHFMAVYFDEKESTWKAYDDSRVSIEDSSIAFVTDHLTKLSWWWDEECFLYGYTNKFVNDKVTVFYDTSDWVLLDEYAKNQKPQQWHLPAGDPEYETPVMIQDMAHFCNEAMTAFGGLKLSVPESIVIYADNIDDYGEVGWTGMTLGHLTISVNNDSPDLLRSVVAHEYMHFTQDYYISAHAGNTFWMEANGHTADRMVWDTTKLALSESERYLLDSRGKEHSIFNFLSTSWDHWDRNIALQKKYGNLDYSYLAGCFIHYMRSYRPGTKLQPDVLLKDNTYTGAWKDYLNDYIANHLNSTIGAEFENYVKYIFEGTQSKFTVLNKDPGSAECPLKYINQAKENFTQKRLYLLPEDQVEIPMLTDQVVRELPYLSARMEQFFNLTANRSLCVKYKRLHSDTANTKVYICHFDPAANRLKMEDVSRLDSSFFFIKAATEENMKGKATQAYMLIINKAKDVAVTARYDLKIVPVADFEYCYNLSFETDDNFNLTIHQFSDGEPRRILMGLSKDAGFISKTYTDSSFTTSYKSLIPSVDLVQEVYYNFLNGDMRITETFHLVTYPAWNPQGCTEVATTTTATIELKDIFLAPMEKEFVLLGAGIYQFHTQTTANTTEKVVSITYEGTETFTDETGGVSATNYHYTGTDWGYSLDIDLGLQFK